MPEACQDLRSSSFIFWVVRVDDHDAIVGVILGHHNVFWMTLSGQQQRRVIGNIRNLRKKSQRKILSYPENAYDRIFICLISTDVSKPSLTGEDIRNARSGLLSTFEHFKFRLQMRFDRSKLS